MRLLQFTVLFCWVGIVFVLFTPQPAVPETDVHESEVSCLAIERDIYWRDYDKHADELQAVIRKQSDEQFWRDYAIKNAQHLKLLEGQPETCPATP